MAKYIVEERTAPRYEKNYKLPMVNIIPAIVWSIPLHQKLFPDASWWGTLFLCALFVVVYWYLSMKPMIAAIPCVAGVVMFTALFWVFADYIGNIPGRIIVKVMILAFFIMLEFCIWINASLPWMERKTETLPRIRKIKD